MIEIFDGKPAKRRGRPLGAPNKITRDIRGALRDLAEGNAGRVQSWLDSVAQKDPAEALRLWLALLRYVTPTLQAAAIADVTPKKPQQALYAMSDAELLAIIRGESSSIEPRVLTTREQVQSSGENEELLR